MNILILSNEAETLEFGKKLAKACPKACVIYLEGELGAGKTTLVRGFLRGLGYQGKVKSPTYTLVEPYAVENQKIFHFDLYRVEHPSELDHMGIRDYFTEDAICLVEWPERGKSILPSPDLHCRITLFGQGRQIELKATSTQGIAMVKNLQNSWPPDATVTF